MLPGEVGVWRDGDLRHDENFVVRRAHPRHDRASRPTGRARSPPAYGRLVDELAAYAYGQARAPVFLLGTSQGTIAAMNGAAHARPGIVSDLVLTESVALPGRLSTETVFDADPQDVRVPALVVADATTPATWPRPPLAPRIAAAMARSPSVRVLAVSGGVQQSEKACSSLSLHGYYGVKAGVVDKISAWLRAHGG